MNKITHKAFLGLVIYLLMGCNGRAERDPNFITTVTLQTRPVAEVTDKFHNDPEVMKMASCAQTAMMSVGGGDWKRYKFHLYDKHFYYLPKVNFEVRQTEVDKAILDAKNRLWKQGGVGDRKSNTAWYDNHCI